MTLTNIIITAYCYGTLTANGHHPQNLYSIAAPKEIPFGTKVRVEGFADRIFVVEDRMNKRFPNRWDIYMSNREECLKWGIQTRKIKVIE